MGYWTMAGSCLPTRCMSIHPWSILRRPLRLSGCRWGWLSDPGENWTAVDGADAFPSEPTQWRDRDYDGYGDNQTEGAKLIDDFPDNPTQFRDTDEDGWGDNQTYGPLKLTTSQ